MSPFRGESISTGIVRRIRFPIASTTRSTLPMKCNSSMMLLLIADVPRHSIHIRIADAECRIAGLPGKSSMQNAMFMDPSRRV
jgi:hypothetical protein